MVKLSLRNKKYIETNATLVHYYYINVYLLLNFIQLDLSLIHI